MPNPRRQTDFEQTHFELKRISLWLFFLMLPMLAACVFPVPFPFVRQIWTRELFGFTGLLNVLFFGWISQRMKKMHLPPVIAGIGLFIHEIILTLYGFAHLTASGQAGEKDFLFLAASMIMSLIYFTLLLRAVGPLIRYKKWFYHDGPGAEEKIQSPGFLPLLLSLLIYATLFVAAYQSGMFSWRVQAAILKGAGQGGSFLAFLGIGYEIQFHLRQEQSALQCGVKGLSHLTSLAIILWLVYRLLPIEAMLRG